MKAVVLRRFGNADELRVEELPDPAPGPGQIRIAVWASGTNPVDAHNRQDGSWAGIDVPCVLGYDVAGVVDAVGPGVQGPAVGDRVVAMMRFPRGAGGYAQLVVVDAELVAELNPDIDFVEAAATPLAAGTAYEVLERLALGGGDTVLVLGASGGVGLFLVQLAASRGLRVIAVGRREMHAVMEQLGARACIDYTTDEVPSRATSIAQGPVDAIADLVGGRHLARSLGALRPRGAAASIATPILDADPILDNNITFHGVLIDDDGERTRRLAALLNAGTLRPHVSRVLPLSAAAEAHRILERGHAGGKVVLAVRGSGA